MAKIDVYHKAFIDYRKETEKDKSCAADRKRIKHSGLEFDVLRSTKYKCTIDDEWIKKIEVGLEFVEKAVAEERQFIRVNGEVVPIEKAKKISKHSVEHLARHSNMITHVPTDPKANLVPDAIYMVEKLNDYAVYENRFLYMLLCYLRDFIDLRLNKIYRLRMTYYCDFSFKKDMESRNRNYQFESTFHDERFDNPYPIPDDRSNELLKRIEDCQQIIIMLLNTDLMVEVSKSPMIKPPIVKTNVLKMNNNFIRSLALYDYIASYKGDGYFSEEIVHDFIPLEDTTADELAELVTLTNYLTYKYGNDIQEVLDAEYERQEEIKRKKEEERLLQQIERMKKRVEETGKSLEEYIMLLEKRNRMLENDAQELIIARNEILKLNEEIEKLNLEKQELNRKIERLEDEIQEKIREIAYLHEKYQQEIKELKEQHAREIEELNAAHEEEIDNLTEDYENQIEELKQDHENKINEINLMHEENIQLIKNAHNEQINDLNRLHNEQLVNQELKLNEEFNHKSIEFQSKITVLTGDLSNLREQYDLQNSNYTSQVNDLNKKIFDTETELSNKIDDYEGQLKELEKTYKLKIKEVETKNKQLTNDRNLAIAELDAIRVVHGEITPSEEFTSKERFKELEKEFEAFNTFFKAQWAMTKKEIRKQLLWKKEDQKRKVIAEAKKKEKEKK